MHIAWSEIKFQPKKFILIEVLYRDDDVHGHFPIRTDKWIRAYYYGPNLIRLGTSLYSFEGFRRSDSLLKSHNG